MNEHIEGSETGQTAVEPSVIVTEVTSSPSVATATDGIQQTDADYLQEPDPQKTDRSEVSEFSSEAPEPTYSKRPNQNVFLDSVVSKDNPDPAGISISLPSDTSTRTEEVITNIPNIDVSGTEQGTKWAQAVQAALGLNSYEDVFLSTLEDQNADFHQSLEVNGTKFGSNEVKFRERQNTSFDGEAAVLRTISHLGLGSTWNTGLYNTGIWITFKPPTEEDLVELYRQLTADQIEMGRMSYGLAYANTSSYHIERLCRFAQQHIYRINANPDEIGPANILDHIKSQDITSLLWGLACTMFPKGFNYSRACMVDPEKCQHVTNEILNLRKLQLVNRAGLTDRQKAHMAEHRGGTKITVKDLQSYGSEMTRASFHRVVVNEGEKDEITINLRSPSITEYIQTGHRWIDDMVNNVEQVLGSTGTVEEKNKLIDMKSRATIMRQYCHWVSSIELDTNQITDRASIEKVLNNISGDQNIRETFLTEVKKFIENSSVSVVGIPTYDCPKCGKPNEGNITFPYRTNMIPIDVIQLFFVLLTQKRRDLENR